LISFMSTSLCICGMGYGLPWHGFYTFLYLKWPLWQVPVTNSAIEQRLESEQNWELLLSICCTKVRAVLLYYGWDICFLIFGIQYFHHPLGSCVGAYWLLSMIPAIPKCSRIVGGLAQKMILSVLIYSTRCEYDSLDFFLKKLTGTCPLGRSKTKTWDPVGIVLDFYLVLRW
jgi:hypothetical protein